MSDTQTLYDYYNRVNNGLRNLPERVVETEAIRDKVQAVLLAYIELEKELDRQDALARIEVAKASIRRAEQELRLLDGVEEEDTETP